MYSEYLQFREASKHKDDERFWFREDVHHPFPILPLETVIPEAIKIGIGQAATRLFAIPQASGLDQRIVNGRMYFGPVAPPSSEVDELPSRVSKQRIDAVFDRFDYYFAKWKAEMFILTEDLSGLQVPSLPEIEPDSAVLQGPTMSAGSKLVRSYELTISALFQAWSHHFFLLNIGYSELIDFQKTARRIFPLISGSSVSAMLQRGDLEIFEPHRAVIRLAKAAESMDLLPVIRSSKFFDDVESRPRDSDIRRIWLAQLAAEKSEWFEYFDGSGFYAKDQTWSENPDLVLKMVVAQIGASDSPKLAQKDPISISDGYLALIENTSDAADFQRCLLRARIATPYLEDHNLYVEHRFQSVFWRKLRAFATRLIESGHLRSADDIFYFNRWEIAQTLYDVSAAWAAGGDPVVADLWRDRVDRRKGIFEQFMSTDPPPPALGRPPTSVNDPMLESLFEVTVERIAQWNAGQVDNTDIIAGVAASTGDAAGPAWVVATLDDLASMPTGSVLVCSCLLPSWGGQFSRAAAVICENGGVLSHAAITCREFNIPSVVSATGILSRVHNGRKLQVNGYDGNVRFI